MLENLLRQMKLQTGLDIERMENETHRYRFTIGEHSYYLLNLPHSLLLLAELGLPKKPKGEIFLTHLMRADFLGQGTGSGVVALEPSEKNFIFTLPMIPDVPFRTFHDNLELFINYSEYWRGEVQKEMPSIFK